MRADEDAFEWLRQFNDGDDKQLVKELRTHIAGGSFRGWMQMRARIELWRANRRLKAAFGSSPEGVSLRQARAAEHSARAAYIALVISIVALAVSLVPFFRR